MTLLLGNDEIQSVLDMRAVVEVLRTAYLEMAAGGAGPGLRSDIAAPSSLPGAIYALKVYGSVFPRGEVAAVRLTSDLISWSQHAGSKRRNKIPGAPGGRWVGLVWLFSTRTGEPLAVFPDGVVQRMRVGGTSAIGMDLLARRDATKLAIIGAGWQAGAQAMGACAVRPITRVRVYSPTAQHREQFCQDWERALGVEFRPADSVQEAVGGADVVLCATNSTQPVLEAGILEPGMHVGAIRLHEIGEDVVSRADVVACHSITEHVTHELIAAVDTPEVRSDRGADESRTNRLRSLPELVDLVSGRVPGRASGEQITCFINNYGLGIQFAAVGYALLEAAKASGVGRELPTEWFTESVHP